MISAFTLAERQCFPFSQIKVCSNYVRIQDDVNQVVIRELIHAFDDCRGANLDWSDCAHHACTEVRILQCFPTLDYVGFSTPN